MNAIKQFFLDLQIRLWLALHGAKTHLAEERGDTNFISIAIVLIVVIGIAVTFITLGDGIKKAFETEVGKLKEALHIN